MKLIEIDGHGGRPAHVPRSTLQQQTMVGGVAFQRTFHGGWTLDRRTRFGGAVSARGAVCWDMNWPTTGLVTDQAACGLALR